MSSRDLTSRLARLLSRVSLLLPLPLAVGVACAPVTVTGAGASVDAGALDAAVVDAATSGDGGSAEPDGSACVPGDVATFQPVYHPPAVQPQACTPELVGLFFTACLGASRTTDACNDFRKDNPECSACILTPEAPASPTPYGPLIDHGAFVTANVAGCIEVEVESAAASDGGGAGSAALVCAKAVDALGGCQLAACEANCPVSAGSAASLAQFQACASSADASGCRTFASAVSCTQPDSGVGVPPACLQSDFSAFYDSVVPLFCLPPPPVDAGAASYDGPTGD
jgi:hypothetical protein